MAITKRRPGATSEGIQSLQVPEATAVWSLVSQGFVREIYFDAGKPAVVLILESENLEAARSQLAKLPMVAAGLIEFDFTVLGPYRQLETLFAR